MRVLFIIVGLLGLILAGSAIFEIRAANDYRLRVGFVQNSLQLESAKEIEAKKKMGAQFTGQTLGGELIPALDGFDKFRNGWFVIAGVSLVLLTVSFSGILAGRKQAFSSEAPSSTNGPRPSNRAFIILAIFLAAASWPLLYLVLVRQFVDKDAPNSFVLFLSWIASGFFWGTLVELLYRNLLIKKRNPSPTEAATL